MNRLFASLVFGVGMTGCFSLGNWVDDDAVTIQGSLEDKEGKPLASKELYVFESLTSLCRFSVHHTDISKTDAQGFFKEETLASVPQTCFRFEMPSQPDGTWLNVSFSAEQANIQLPPLRLWKPSVSHALLPSGEVEFTFGTGPAMASTTAEKISFLEGRLETSKGLLAFFTLDVALPKVTLSPLLLEDFELQTAQSKFSKFENQGVQFDLQLQSSREPVYKGSLIPASRGASCSEKNEAGLCVFTDGELAARTVVGPSPSITLDFARSVKPQTVVLHGSGLSGTNVTFEGSNDGGATWVSLPNTLRPVNFFNIFDLQTSSGFQQLRVKIDQTEAVVLAEFSVFE